MPLRRRAPWLLLLAGCAGSSSPLDLRAFRTEDDGFVADLPMAGASFRFDRESAGPGLKLVSWGRAGAVVVAAPVAPRLAEGLGMSASRLEYSRGPLVEWWLTGVTGVELGFDVAEPPAGSGRIELRVRAAGGVFEGARVWIDGSGRRWEIGVVSANDATGRSLPAGLELDGDSFVMWVDDAGAEYPIRVDPVLTTASTSLSGEAAGSTFGSAVAGAGDVDDDGLADVIVGAPAYEADAGRAYLYLGTVDGLASVPASGLEAGVAGGRFGGALAAAGDVDGDGYGDVIVGEEGQNRAWVYRGDAGGLTTVGVALDGGAGSVQFGRAVGAADVNGDGYTDVLVGDGGRSGGRGRVSAFMGSSGGVGTSASRTIDGTVLGGGLGEVVAGVGDLDGDGYEDVVVAAPMITSNAGAFYVYAGGAGGLSGTARSSVTGRAGAGVGSALAGGCDLDGDGFADLVVGAPSDGAGVGTVSIYLGDTAGLGAAARAWTGPDGGGFGSAVGCLGDTDGDGYDDVAIGAPGASGGRVYVFHGSASGARSSATETLSTAAGVAFGGAVGSAGDVDGDGAWDLVVGDEGADPDVGSAYLYLGDADLDGDGYGASVDCDDAATTVRPGATEVPGDGIDEDCDGAEICYVDEDDDAYRSAGLTTLVSADADCDDAGEASVSAPTTDCDDTSALIHPEAAEVVGDSIDEDCDGNEVCYEDKDNDGFRIGTTVTSGDLDCTDAGEALPSEAATDCDDTDGHVYPSATEVVADGADQDCDGVDRCFLDADDDGHRPDTYSTATSSDLDCIDPGEAEASDPVDDCEDADPTIYPGAIEGVADGIDQDCDTWEICYADADIDGYRVDTLIGAADLTCTAGGLAVASTPSDDCDDTLASIHPDATEILGDGIDQDCDGAEICFVDADGDGYRHGSTITVASVDVDCLDVGEAASAAPTTDCDDADAAVHPGVADADADGIDSDCDGSEVCYVDADDDGYRTDVTILSADADCLDSGEALGDAPLGDCDDTSRAVRPGVLEFTADGVDQDCDGLESCYADSDADGYRPDVLTLVVSTDVDCVDAGEADDSVPTGDCDDSDATIRPDASEVTGDSVDQNCDGTEICFVDNDGDGYHIDLLVSSVDMDCADRGEAATSDPAGDCDDSSAAVNPGAAEVPDDGVDQSCDGAESCYVDADGDGWRPDDTTFASSTDLACNGSGMAASDAPTGDCADLDPTIHPEAVEGVGDGLDQDCDGVESCYLDGDLDGYRTDAALASPDLDCEDPGEVPDTTPAGDCDDADAAVHPGVTEIVADHIDQDCDGTEICYADADSDQFRPDDTSTVVSPDMACDAAGEAPATARTNDCDDTDGTVHPGAEELPGDGVDGDCDGEELCFMDADSDGFVADEPARSEDVDCLDAGETSGETPSGDCDDTNPAAKPGAVEVCNGFDDDCDGTADGPTAEGTVTWAADADGDGYTNPNDTHDDCAPTDGYGSPSAQPDCDDTDGEVSPGAPEVAADGVDNDCDGLVDEEAAADTGVAEDTKPGCGCAAGSGGAGGDARAPGVGVAALGLLVAAQRRRRSTVSRIQRSSAVGKSSV